MSTAWLPILVVISAQPLCLHLGFQALKFKMNLVLVHTLVHTQGVVMCKHPCMCELGPKPDSTFLLSWRLRRLK